MFKPIVHNLLKTDKGFKECQEYNKLIGNKAHFTQQAFDLQGKIHKEQEWRSACLLALEAVKQTLKVE